MSQQKGGFQCRTCHAWHDELPMSYSVKAPFAVAAIPEAELDQRVIFTPDQCVIDKRKFYLRGRIPVRVVGVQELFIWGVWAKVEEDDFLRSDELWRVEGRESEMAYRGWLDTALPMYGDTLNLAVKVHTQPVGRRPHFELIDETNPLAVEQRTGITMQRVQELAEWFRHSGA